MDKEVILEIRNLSVRYRTRKGPIMPVANVSLRVREGECLGIAGESGCGKSTLALAVMKLLPPNARISTGSILLNGEDLVPLSEKEYGRRIWGKRIIMISQNPHDALDPVFRVRDQLEEILWVHEKSQPGNHTAQRESHGHEIERILTGMGIPDISRVLGAYPHQLSGGMKQRILTAMAFFCNPSILIADEPTTALDTTIAAQVTEMFKDLMKAHSTSLVYISHDLALLSELSTSVAVMYAGEIVEYGKTADIASKPMHPYTTALLAALPSASKSRLDSIPGRVPDLSNPTRLCQFSPRCREKGGWCTEEKPELLEVTPGHWARCSKFLTTDTDRSIHGAR
jgi:oligopeptide/dipeptide ABC transporter ATP-binding protein